MNKKILLFFLSFMSLDAHHKIIYFIAPPRSLSTVFLRAMHARGDMIVYNEPSQYSYYKQHDLYWWAYPNTPLTSYEKVKQSLLEASQKSMVFAKEISFVAYEWVYDDEEFIADPDVEFCFLIRNPHASLISHYKTIEEPHNNGFEWIVDWIVYERHYALFEKIKKIRNQAPLVISSEQLTAHPQTTMKLFCQKVGIPFEEAMLSWPSLEDNFEPLMWNEYKQLYYCKHWHKNAIKSTHFKPCERNYDVDSNGYPTFIEIGENERSTVKELYDYYMKFYNSFKNYLNDVVNLRG